jgi:hypothetical protein
MLAPVQAISEPYVKPSLLPSSSIDQAKINMNDYAYNKIFVGGLHYDTKDGKMPQML